MSKITDAQAVLAALQLPSAQQTEMAALTLLVLAQLDENTPWSDAKRQSLRIHDMLQEMNSRYGRSYAENTRETVRRQVIHQFEQARIVDRNPDEPGLPTNSPRTHYALTDVAIRTIRQFNTPDWNDAVSEFLEAQQSLMGLYERKRERQMIPLTYPMHYPQFGEGQKSGYNGIGIDKAMLKGWDHVTTRSTLIASP